MKFEVYLNCCLARGYLFKKLDLGVCPLFAYPITDVSHRDFGIYRYMSRKIYGPGMLGRDALTRFWVLVLK